MAYTLHAILGPQDVLADHNRIVELPQGIAMIPIVGQRGGEPFFERYSIEVARLAERLSRAGCIVAYVEAEFFGGVGDQRAVVWRDGRVEPKRIEGAAINEVLKLLGVRRDGDRDEFDTVGLGRYRRTEQWK